MRAPLISLFLQKKTAGRRRQAAESLASCKPKQRHNSKKFRCFPL
jgi:hypothetical protein